MQNLSTLSLPSGPSIPVNGVDLKRPLQPAAKALTLSPTGRVNLSDAAKAQTQAEIDEKSMSFTLAELGQQLKQQHPDVLGKYTDEEVGNKMLERKPELAKYIIEPEKKMGFLDKVISGGASFLKGMASPVVKTGLWLGGMTPWVGHGTAANAKADQYGLNAEGDWEGSKVQDNSVDVPLYGKEYAPPEALARGDFKTAAKNITGYGLEMAALLAGGGLAAGAGKAVVKGTAKEAIKGLAAGSVKELAKQGAKTSAMIGGAGSLGATMQDNNATGWDMAKNTLIGTALGAGLGAIAPYAAKGVGKMMLKSKDKALVSGKLAEYVAPKANKELSLGALKKGTAGIEESGLLKSGKIKASARDMELARNVNGVVNPKKTYVKNIDALNEGITDVSENVVTPFLKDNPALYNENLLKGKFNAMKEEKLGFLLTDEQSAKLYDKVIDQALEIADAQPTKDMYGLWKSRVEFDKWVERNFGDKVLHSESLRSARDEAMRNVRNAMNDFIAEHTPNGQFKELMGKLSSFYAVRDNLAAKAFAEGVVKTSKLQSFYKKYKTPIQVGGSLIGGGTAVGVGSRLLD